MVTEFTYPGPEVKDARSVYLNHPKRKDKTARVFRQALKSCVAKNSLDDKVT